MCEAGQQQNELASGGRARTRPVLFFTEVPMVAPVTDDWLTDADRRTLDDLVSGLREADCWTVGTHVIGVAIREGWSHPKATAGLHYAVAQHAQLPLVMTGPGGTHCNRYADAQAVRAWYGWIGVCLLLVAGLAALIALGW